MGKSAIFEILKNESPFFISDIVNKYPKYKRGYVWQFIQMHSELFEEEIPKSNTRGRPPILYRVKSNEIYGK